MSTSARQGSLSLININIAMLLLCACGAGGPSPEALAPEDPTRLDASVLALVEEQMSAMRASPRDGGAYARLGLVYEANLLWPEARRAFAAAVALDGTAMWWRFHLAVATRVSGDPEGGLRLLSALAAEHPDLAPVQQRLGEALAERGELAAAAAAYGRVVNLMPDAPEGYQGLGAVMLMQREYAQASALLEHAVALDPRYRAARYALGLAYRGLGRPEDAARELARGVDANPRYLPSPLASELAGYAVNLQARRNAAAMTLHAGRPDQAAFLLEQIVKGQHNTDDLNHLAIAYMRMGRFESARARLDEARRLAPDKFTTWLNLSSLAARMGETDAAVTYAENAVERAPDIASTHMALARAVAEAGQLERAAKSLERAARLDPRDPQAHGMLGETYVRLGRLEDAEQQFQRVLALLPDSLAGVLGLGRVYLAQGRLDSAGAMLARARELAPGTARVASFASEVRQHTPEDGG